MHVNLILWLSGRSQHFSRSLCSLWGQGEHSVPRGPGQDQVFRQRGPPCHLPAGGAATDQQDPILTEVWGTMQCDGQQGHEPKPEEHICYQKVHTRAPDKLRFFISKTSISWPDPMFDHLLASSHRDDSNKWSNIGFGQETKELGSI